MKGSMQGLSGTEVSPAVMPSPIGPQSAMILGKLSDNSMLYKQRGLTTLQGSLTQRRLPAIHPNSNGLKA